MDSPSKPAIMDELVGLRQMCAQMQQELRQMPVYFRASDGLPIPPLEYRALVSGREEYVSSFFETGNACARRIVESLKKHGVEIDDFQTVLDFGCGCGRTIRHFHYLKKAQLYGTDYNPKLVEWCKGNLPFARFGLNLLEPPLVYAGQSFDFVYAFSVFTHLPEQLQFSWMDELSRILRPGGYLVISTIDENFFDIANVDPSTRQKVLAGQFVVWREELAGANECLAFHPFAYVKENLTKGFEILEHIPPGGWFGQTFYLLKKVLKGKADDNRRGKRRPRQQAR